mmetsp:Transcript_19646/g.29411  ORF Transcript_19646/g.29411 Transcript_19646/m.29411 type:complete len:144 (+) Transcript_19646:76-507(+)
MKTIDLFLSIHDISETNYAKISQEKVIFVPKLMKDRFQKRDVHAVAVEVPRKIPKPSPTATSAASTARTAALPGPPIKNPAAAPDAPPMSALLNTTVLLCIMWLNSEDCFLKFDANSSSSSVVSFSSSALAIFSCIFVMLSVI